MNKKKIFCVGLVFLFLQSYKAQIGINTESPQATLDIDLPSNYASGTKAGVAIPRLTGDQIEAISISGIKIGTLIYSTSASTATTKDITSVGYWFWKNTTDKWEPLLINAPRFFYSPSIPINTSVSAGSINLYTNYKNQFTSPMASSTGALGAIQTFAANELEYYVTWYDNTIFNNVAIDANGVLTYNILSTADTSKPTYMNVVFVVK